MQWVTAISLSRAACKRDLAKLPVLIIISQTQTGLAAKWRPRWHRDRGLSKRKHVPRTRSFKAEADSQEAARVSIFFSLRRAVRETGANLCRIKKCSCLPESQLPLTLWCITHTYTHTHKSECWYSQIYYVIKINILQNILKYIYILIIHNMSK